MAQLYPTGFLLKPARPMHHSFEYVKDGYMDFYRNAHLKL